MSPARPTLLFLLLSLPPALLLAWSALAPPPPLSPAAQGCRMSWMSPSYLLQPGVNASSPLRARYRLWLYREVGWDADAPAGQPVLFLPGNAGSFKQARSLASSASRQFWAAPHVRAPAFPAPARPLDFFAVDTNEELSAWDAATLSAQAAYATAAVAHILALYSGPAPPSDVLVVAHSMGGLVARLMLRADPPPAVQTVIALSTPHAFPPLPISRALERLYAPAPLPPDVLFLSVCGGSQDVEFPSEMCAAWAAGTADQDQNQPLTYWASGTEGTWTGVGHREMVWCHQVRWRVARAALEMSLHPGLADRQAVARRWFGEGAPLALQADAAGPVPGREEEEEGRTELPGPAFELPHPRLGSAYALPAAERDTPFALMHPMTLAVQLHSCAPAPGGACVPAPVGRRKLLPYPPAGLPFPRPGEGAGETEGVVYLEVALEKGRQLVVRPVAGAGWVVGRPSQDVVRNDAPFLNAVLGYVDAELPPPASRALRSTIAFDNLYEHALLVYRASLLAGDCSSSSSSSMSRPASSQRLLPPMLASSSPEAFFNPDASHSPTYLTSHTAAAPFLPLRPRSALTLDLWSSGSSSACDVTHVRVTLDLWASVGRVMGRYRVLLAAWSVGVAGVLSLIACRAWDGGAPFPTVPAALAYYLAHVLPGLALALLAAALLPLPPAYVLGTGGVPLLAVLAPLLLGTATALVVLSWGILCVLVSCGAAVLRVLRVRAGSPSNGRSGLRHYLPLAAFALALVLFVPSHFVFLVAFAIQLHTTARAKHALGKAGQRPSDTPRLAAHHAQAQHLLLMLFWLLPLTAPFAAVWVRTLAARGLARDTALALTLTLPADRDPLAVLCAVITVENASAGRVWDRANRPIQKWGTLALLTLLSGYCFLLGGRHTYGIYEGVELYFLASLARPALRNGDHRRGESLTKEDGYR